MAIVVAAILRRSWKLILMLVRWPIRVWNAAHMPTGESGPNLSDTQRWLLTFDPPCLRREIVVLEFRFAIRAATNRWRRDDAMSAFAYKATEGFGSAICREGPSPDIS